MDKKNASTFEAVRRAAEEGRQMRRQADLAEHANRTAVDQKRERETERWLTQQLPGLVREAGRTRATPRRVARRGSASARRGMS